MHLRLLLTFGAVFLLLGCDAEPRSSLLSDKNLDLNNDGELDVFYEDEESGFYELIDRNFDKKIDESHHFNLNSRIIGSKVDDNFDGVLETKIEYRHGSISKVLVDSDGDLKFDIFFEYKDGTLLAAKKFYQGRDNNSNTVGTVRFKFNYPNQDEIISEVDFNIDEFESYALGNMKDSVSGL